jgi:hypothetical protein
MATNCGVDAIASTGAGGLENAALWAEIDIAYRDFGTLLRRDQ